MYQTLLRAAAAPCRNRLVGRQVAAAFPGPPGAAPELLAAADANDGDGGERGGCGQHDGEAGRTLDADDMGTPNRQTVGDRSTQ